MAGIRRQSPHGPRVANARPHARPMPICANATVRNVAFDPRLTPARPDVAAKPLYSQVEAARFVEGEICEVVDPIAPLRRSPMSDAPLDTEALKGERVTIYDINEEGWCWGQLQSDGYVGWLPANALM